MPAYIMLRDMIAKLNYVLFFNIIFVYIIKIDIIYRIII